MHKKVLVLDDDRDAIVVISDMLTSFGHNPFCISHPKFLFHLLEKENIDLILLDYYMPAKGGSEILLELKSDPRYETIPVIMLTGETDEKNLEKCLNLGAIDYIHKPISEVVLNARIRSAMVTQDYIGLLKNLNKKMTDFVGIVSHDLRSPIGTIRMFSDLLLDPEHTPDIPVSERSIIERIKNASNSALDLIRDLLDLTAIETGRIKITLAPVEFYNIAAQTIEEHVFLARNKHIKLVLDVNKNVFVTADAKRIRQVLDNLITNAIKFTPHQGTVTIRATITHPHLQIDIHDTGMGIKEENRKKLFDKLQKFSTKGTDGESGTGFGLPLSQELIIEHGSAIEVHSNSTGGTTFRFYLPLQT